MNGYILPYQEQSSSVFRCFTTNDSNEGILRVYFNIDKKLKKSIFNASNSILDIFSSLLLYNKKGQHMLSVSISCLPGMGLLER